MRCPLCPGWKAGAAGAGAEQWWGARGLRGAHKGNAWALVAPCPAWLRNQGLPRLALCRSMGCLAAGCLLLPGHSQRLVPAQLRFPPAPKIPRRGSRNLLHKTKGDIDPLVGNGVISHCPRAPKENSLPGAGVQCPCEGEVGGLKVSEVFAL